jgi:hypothetical protein
MLAEEGVLGPVQAVINGLISIVIYAIILAGVVKLFQIASDMSEIKDLLQDIKRNTQDGSPSKFSPARSPENLLRAVAAESYPQEASIEPAVGDPQR